MKKLLPTVAVAMTLVMLKAYASTQPLCQMQVQVNPDGGASYQGATAGVVNSCAPVNQDGGYGTSAALCKGIGPRMTISVQSTASGRLQLTKNSSTNAGSTSLHMSAQSDSPSKQQLNGLILQPVGSGEACVSFAVDNYDGGTQTINVFTETSAPSFTDNGVYIR